MNSMNYIGKFISNFRDFYNEINAATLTGAIDVVVVEQSDGSFNCSPFHVRFGKLGVLRSREKVVDIEINGEPLDIHMKLGESGEAFFVEEVDLDELGEDEFIPPHLACSPIPQDGFLPHYRDSPTDQLYQWPPEQDTSTPKTFRAETVESNEESCEKVRRISVVAGEFRPIVFQEDVGSDLTSVVVETPGGHEPATEDLPHALADTLATRKEQSKDSIPLSEDLLKPNSATSGKRKRRRKSLMKKKAGLKKGHGGSINQTEQSEISENGKESNSRPISQDTSEEIFQIDDVNEDMQEHVAHPPCTHLGGIMMLNNKEGKFYSSADCDTCLRHPTPPTITVTSACTMTTTSLVDNTAELSRIQHASTETDFHFFSDTEITPGCSRSLDGRRISSALSDSTFEVLASSLRHFPHDSRPSTPVQSDTEFEMNRQSKAVGTEDEEHGKSHELQQSWRWGELPSPPPRPLLVSQTSRSALKMEQTQPEPISSSDDETSKKQQEAVEAAQRSMLSGMFSFMKKTKRLRHNPEAEGIYLSDLNSGEMDPEVAALYFPTSYRGEGSHQLDPAEAVPRDEEDAESGNGTSLPQSPHSVEGAIGGPKSLDSDFEEPKNSLFENKCYGEISMSLCGGLSDQSSIPSQDSFLRSLVTYNDLVRNPKVIDNPNLVVQLNGKYYNWRTACPLVMSLVLYQRPLPQPVVDGLAAEYMPLKKGSNETSGRGYASWFYWRRTTEPKKMLNKSQDQLSLDKGVAKNPLDQTPETPDEVIEIEEHEEEGTKAAGELGVTIPRPTSLESEPETGVGTQTSLPGTPDLHKDSKEEGYSGSNSSDESDGGRSKLAAKMPMERRSYYDHSEKYRKTLRLSSDQIASLNLNEGGNEVVFSVTTAYQGTTRCKCHIYKWRHDDKVVISDIDGTITKSDVLGHILPIVGKDWAQSGVAQLFTKIKNNGYKLLYLSARAIGQARVTREYLRSIKQGDLSLPDGPLLLNPTSLISAFHREVIEKKPEEFKISCLRDIQALFPVNSKPFYAGYGNKVNDVWAYRAVGIPIFRIFTINHRGELKHELTQTFQSSYSNMSYIVDQMFPPPPEYTSEEFTNFIYWRDPIPDLVMDLQLPVDQPPTDKAVPVA